MFPGYTSYHLIREQRRGGGVSGFINNKFKSNQIHEHSYSYNCLESVCINIKKRSKNILIATYYRPPVDSLYEKFTNVLSSQLNTLIWCSINLTNCGDFNFDFLKIYSDLKVTTFYDPTSAYLLTPIITKSTSITLANKKRLFFKTHTIFLYILERNDILNTMLHSDFP